MATRTHVAITAVTIRPAVPKVPGLAWMSCSDLSRERSTGFGLEDLARLPCNLASFAVQAHKCFKCFCQSAWRGALSSQRIAGMICLQRSSTRCCYRIGRRQRRMVCGRPSEALIGGLSCSSAGGPCVPLSIPWQKCSVTGRAQGRVLQLPWRC